MPKFEARQKRIYDGNDRLADRRPVTYRVLVQSYENTPVAAVGTTPLVPPQAVAKVAAVQMHVGHGTTLDDVLAMAEHAAKLGIKVLVLPEYVASAQWLPDRTEALSLTDRCPRLLEQAGAVCIQYGCYMVLSLVERVEGDLFPTAYLVGPSGAVVGRYRKVRLTEEDATLLLDVIAGRDPRDPNSVDCPIVSYLSYVGTDVSGLRVGVPSAAFEGADAEVARAVQAALDGFREAGCTLQPLDEPSSSDLEMTNAAGMIVSRAEAATLHHHLLTERSDRYTAETFDQLDEASRVPAVVYLAAQRLREEFRQRMLNLFSRVNALALPTSLVLAPPVEEAERYLLVLSRNCIPWSFVGFPAVSVPCGRSASGLPIGLQLVAPPFHDGRLIALGSAVETFGLWEAKVPT